MLHPVQSGAGSGAAGRARRRREPGFSAVGVAAPRRAERVIDGRKASPEKAPADECAPQAATPGSSRTPRSSGTRTPDAEQSVSVSTPTSSGRRAAAAESPAITPPTSSHLHISEQTCVAAFRP